MTDNMRRGLAGLLGLGAVDLFTGGLVTVALAAERTTPPITEREFNRRTGHATVDMVLGEYGIGSVDDASYQRKVYGSDKHVMVLFYNNRSQGSKGLAVLIGLLGKEFGSKFDVFGYKLGERERASDNMMRHVHRLYGVDKAPIVLLYKNSDLPNVNERIAGGILTYSNLNRMMGIVTKYINNNII
ncbi:MAG: hypothetical protein ABIG89_03735 [Candidatus Woesearchaeota archaeon]